MKLFKGNYSYEEKGTKIVKATTAGAEKTRLPMAFCCAANGDKLPILIVIPRKKPLKDFVPPENVMLVYRGANNNTFNSEYIRDQFIDRILMPHKYRYGHKKAHIILDLKEKLSQNGFGLTHIPPRITGFLQPADVVWFKPIKTAFHRKWSDWYMNDPKAFTANHNFKSPGYVKVSVKLFLILIK